jgi:hypothetical protein
MKIDLDTIDLAAVKPNSLLILRAPIDTLENSGMEELFRALKGVKPKLPPSVHVLVMPDDMKLEVLPEETMNKAGWFRFNLGMDLATELKAETELCKPTE